MEQIFHEGLVDASNEGEFFVELVSMEKKWNEMEEADSKQQPKFFNWFVKYAYEGQVFADAMIKPRREAAGLGSPPAEFTTNICESGHAALKNYLPKCNQYVLGRNLLKNLCNLWKTNNERLIWQL